MSIKNGLIFGFSTIALLFLTVIIGNVLWYHISNVALRLAAVTLLLSCPGLDHSGALPYACSQI